MAWSFNPASWVNGVTIPNVANFQSIATDLHTLGGNLDSARYGVANAAFATLVPQDLPGTVYTVTAGSWTTGTATLTIGSHNLKVNQLVVVASVTPSGYNNGGVEVALTGVTGTQISYALASNPGAWVSGGTVTAWGTPAAGMIAVTAAGVLEQYSGSAWAAVGGGGTVTHTAGALTSGALVVGNGSADIKVPNSSATLDANGNLLIPGYFAPAGSPVLTLVNGANQNIAIGNRAYATITGPSAGFSIGGFQGGVDGRQFELQNLLSQTMTINNQDAGSGAGNYIFTLTGGNVALRSGGFSVARFTFNSSANGWVFTGSN